MKQIGSHFKDPYSATLATPILGGLLYASIKSETLACGELMNDYQDYQSGDYNSIKIAGDVAACMLHLGTTALAVHNGIAYFYG